MGLLFFYNPFFEVFHHLSDNQGLLDNSAIIQSKNKDVVVDSISKFKKHNVLFFVADYGGGLGNGKFIFLLMTRTNLFYILKLTLLSQATLYMAKSLIIK